MFYNEDHLRVTKVRTADGITPYFGEDGRPQKKIVFFPKNKSTLTLLNESNSRLPTHLKMVIEEVKAYAPQPVQSVPDPKIAAMEKEIAELRAANKELSNNTSKKLQHEKV